MRDRLSRTSMIERVDISVDKSFVQYSRIWEEFLDVESPLKNLLGASGLIRISENYL